MNYEETMKSTLALVRITFLMLVAFVLGQFTAMGPSVPPYSTERSETLSTIPASDSAASRLVTLASNATGGIHACARFTTRYEAHHILPWLVHHKRLGINHFHLYFDRMSSNLRNPIEKRVYDAVNNAPFTTVYDAKELRLYMQHNSLNHCWNKAHLEKQAEWVVDFDIDEVLTVNKPMREKEECMGNENGAGELATWASSLPKETLAVVIPRIDFGSNNVVKHPLKPYRTQLDLYTRRDDRVYTEGKIMVRTPTGGNAKPVGKHQIAIFGNEADATRQRVIYAFGKPAAIVKECEIEKEEDEAEPICFGFNDSDYPSDFHLSAPRIQHYIRSIAERARTAKEIETMPWHNASGMSDWRLKNAQHLSNPRTANVVPDFNLYCAGLATQKVVRRYFPSYWKKK